MYREKSFVDLVTGFVFFAWMGGLVNYLHVIEIEKRFNFIRFLISIVTSTILGLFGGMLAISLKDDNLHLALSIAGICGALGYKTVDILSYEIFKSITNTRK